MSETGAEVIGLDWRVPLDEGWNIVGHTHAVQGNLDPVTLFASWHEVRQRAENILRAGGRTPRAHLQSWARYFAADPGRQREEPRRLRARVQHVGHCSEEVMAGSAVLLIAHGSPERVEDIPEFLQNISRGRPMPEAVVREVQHRYSLIGSSPLTRITRAAGGRRSARAGHAGLRRHAQLASVHRRHSAADGIGQCGTCGGGLPGAAQLAHQRRPVQTGAAG